MKNITLILILIFSCSVYGQEKDEQAQQCQEFLRSMVGIWYGEGYDFYDVNSSNSKMGIYMETQYNEYGFIYNSIHGLYTPNEEYFFKQTKDGNFIDFESYMLNRNTKYYSFYYYRYLFPPRVVIGTYDYNFKKMILFNSDNLWYSLDITKDNAKLSLAFSVRESGFPNFEESRNLYNNLKRVLDKKTYVSRFKDGDILISKDYLTFKNINLSYVFCILNFPLKEQPQDNSDKNLKEPISKFIRINNCPPKDYYKNIRTNVLYRIYCTRIKRIKTKDVPDPKSESDKEILKKIKRCSDFIDNFKGEWEYIAYDNGVEIYHVDAPVVILDDVISYFILPAEYNKDSILAYKSNQYLNTCYNQIVKSLNKFKRKSVYPIQSVSLRIVSKKISFCLEREICAFYSFDGGNDNLGHSPYLLIGFAGDAFELLDKNQITWSEDLKWEISPDWREIKEYELIDGKWKLIHKFIKKTATPKN